MVLLTWKSERGIDGTDNQWELVVMLGPPWVVHSPPPCWDTGDRLALYPGMILSSQRSVLFWHMSTHTWPEQWWKDHILPGPGESIVAEFDYSV